LIRELAPPHVDCLVTGDVKYHMAVEARSKGLGVVDPGHWASEVIVAKPLAAALRRRLRDRGCEVDVMPTRVPDADPLVTL
jgi:putative NIF3 family GTP cyclohydrolase 1 type 2